MALSVLSVTIGCCRPGYLPELSLLLALLFIAFYKSFIMSLDRGPIAQSCSRRLQNGRDHVERGLSGERHQEDDAVRSDNARLRCVQSDSREITHECRPTMLKGAHVCSMREGVAGVTPPSHTKLYGLVGEHMCVVGRSGMIRCVAGVGKPINSWEGVGNWKQ
ncbi:unnamed protein product [Strongylus vulgaris]|uniref:Uncharacterized protein n=1 Tax=Strongylus vulgaris TaxID=40348 RepID=A0A3P7LH50_STRVU|nr:unnamed protein product [Strongylus vulgaris]